MQTSLLIACLAQPPQSNDEMKEKRKVWRISITWLSMAKAAQAARMIIRRCLYNCWSGKFASCVREQKWQLSAFIRQVYRCVCVSAGVCMGVCVCVITGFYWSNDSVDTPHKHIDLICSLNCRISFCIDRLSATGEMEGGGAIKMKLKSNRRHSAVEKYATACK